MALRIISAEERLAESRGIKAAIFGGSGQGKTSLLWTLPADRTIFMDLEAGDLAVEGWTGDTIRPRTWQECRDFAAFIGGPNPALRDEQSYSPAHYAMACEQFGDPGKLDRYETLFVDSISVAGRLCFQWCRGQPEAFSEKSGKPDIRGAYGLHGREMIAWLTHLQHTRGKNIIFVGILDEKLDDFNRKVYVPQIDGSKTGLELPGIVDEVLTLTALKDGLRWSKNPISAGFSRKSVPRHARLRNGCSLRCQPPRHPKPLPPPTASKGDRPWQHGMTIMTRARTRT
jgi:hypothetical protein